MRRSSELLGYSLPPMPRCFQRTLVVFPRRRHQFLDRKTDHPLLSFSSASESLFTCHCPGAMRLDTTSSGFLPPSRHQPTESTQQRASHARLRSALSVSHALDGLLLRAPCRLVSSRCHVRDSHFRGFPAARPSRVSTIAPLLPLPPIAALPCGYGSARFTAPRLQGFHPGSDPLQPIGGLDPIGARSPLVFSAPSGLHPHTLENAFASPPLMVFAAGAACPPDGFPSAYQSICGLPLHLWVGVPFEFPGLLKQRRMPCDRSEARLPGGPSGPPNIFLTLQTVCHWSWLKAHGIAGRLDAGCVAIADTSMRGAPGERPSIGRYVFCFDCL
jgi:hypothetical protein